jgi:thioesterase domain-containing protein
VGINDNFFELGGHSLLAVRLFSEIEKLTGQKLPLVTIFQTPTIRQLARALSHQETGSPGSLLVPLQPAGGKPPLFLVHGAGGDILWGYANLAAHLPPDQPVYGIKSRGQARREELETVEAMAECYVKEIRTLQPRGPYYLGGYCFGGNVSYEMARQLREQGDEIALLLLLDSAPANAGYERIAWWRPSYGFRFARNLAYWLQDFAELPSKDRRRFVVRKARSLARKIVRKLSGHRPAAATVDLEEVIDPAHFPENELKLWKTHLHALEQHVQKQYPGRVVLMRTRGQPIVSSLEEDFCWGKLASGGVDLCRIPGSHENIFMEPHVAALAPRLGRYLAGGSAGSISPLKTTP